MPKIVPTRYYDPNEAAALVGVPLETLQSAITRKQLDCERQTRIGRVRPVRRILGAELLRWRDAPKNPVGRPRVHKRRKPADATQQPADAIPPGGATDAP